MEPVAALHLKTERLVLREFAIDDVGALNAIERDPCVTRFMTFDPQTPQQSLDYVTQRIADQLARPRTTFDLAVLLQSDGRLIGRCGLGIERPDHREAMLWYVLDPRQWGRGLAVEAARAMVGFGFGVLRLHRIWADCDPRNTGSCRVAEKLGMTLEGRLRENWFLKGEWCSTALYAVLDHEFLECAR